MGFLGVTALTLLAAGPAARRIGTDAAVAVTVRLTRVAAVLGLLAIPAVLTDAAHAAFGAILGSLYRLAAA